jgi:hypothetical protein
MTALYARELRYERGVPISLQGKRVRSKSAQSIRISIGIREIRLLQLFEAGKVMIPTKVCEEELCAGMGRWQDLNSTGATMIRF